MSIVPFPAPSFRHNILLEIVAGGPLWRNRPPAFAALKPVKEGTGDRELFYSLDVATAPCHGVSLSSPLFLPVLSNA